jgi:hypothetical protein
MRYIGLLAIALLFSYPSFAQQYDSLYEAREKSGPLKIRHAEPLFVDLIRDLGAHKGEKEWNVGFGLVDNLQFDKYIGLVEYEWAPVNRLGLEVEVPVTIYAPAHNGTFAERPSNRVESIKTAAQWTFHVSAKARASFALGYLNEIEFSDLNTISRSKIFQGNLFNPFFIAAKRIGRDFHTLVYTGPQVHLDFATKSWKREFEFNSNFHYMIPGTRNFIGIEFNKMISGADFEMVIRPQMRVVIHESLLIGIVQGIPVSKDRERFSSFLRLIYEPPLK